MPNIDHGAMVSGLRGSLWVRKFGSRGAVVITTTTLPHCQIPKPSIAVQKQATPPFPLNWDQATFHSLHKAGLGLSQDPFPSHSWIRAGLPPAPLHTTRWSHQTDLACGHTRHCMLGKRGTIALY